MLPFLITFTPVSTPSTRARRQGFTFLEVLFAIMILGIGFILVAAMFPAAIKQTQSTVEDSYASAVSLNTHRKFVELAKNQIPVVQPLPPLPQIPPTYVLDKNMEASGANPGESKVYSIGDRRMTANHRTNLWTAAGGSQLVESDPRYACVPFYRRERDYNSTPPNLLGAADVQMFFVPVRVRNKPEYDLSDLLTTTTGLRTKGTPMANLEPTLFNIQVNVPSAGSPPIITLNGAYDLNRVIGDPGSSAKPVTEDTPAANGAYVIISDCKKPNAFRNGQIYRLGSRVLPIDASKPPQYYIAPDSQGASDVYQSGFTGYSGDAFIVGRGISTQPGSFFDGPPQDLGVIPAPIRVR